MNKNNYSVEFKVKAVELLGGAVMLRFRRNRNTSNLRDESYLAFSCSVHHQVICMLSSGRSFEASPSRAAPVGLPPSLYAPRGTIADLFVKLSFERDTGIDHQFCT